MHKKYEKKDRHRNVSLFSCYETFLKSMNPFFFDSSVLMITIEHTK